MLNGAGTYLSYMSWAIAAPFFSPEIVNDDLNFMLNNNSFRPPPRTMQGSEGYIEIRCSNGAVCGYGAFSPIPQGNNTISWNADPATARDTNVALFASIYGFQRKNSYAYPAGYQCEPIGRKFHVFVLGINSLLFQSSSSTYQNI